MSTVIRSLMVRVGADLTDMEKGLKQASKNLKNIGKDFSSAGSTLTKGLTVPIAGAATALGGIVLKSSSTADELQKMSDVTGISAERLQELKYAGSALGVELDTITGAQAKLTKAMYSAKDGTGSQAEAFKALGISVTDSNGNLRDAQTIMSEAFTALGNMGNETERDALSMQIFGKSAMALNPLIKAGGEGLNQLTEEAQKNGAVMSNESVSALDNFGDSLDAMKLSLQGAAGSVAADLLPSLEKMIPVVKGTIIPAIGDFLKKIVDLITKFGELSPGMQKFIIAMGLVAVGIGPAFSAVGKMSTAFSGLTKAAAAASLASTKAGDGFAGFKAGLSAFMGPVGIALVVIAALAAAAFLIIKNWDQVKAFFATLGEAFSAAWQSIQDGFAAAWEAISRAFTTAFETIKSGLSAAWEWIKSFFSEWGPVILTVIAPFIGIPLLIIQNWDTIKAGLVAVWETVRTAASEEFTAIENTIVNIWNTLKTKTSEIWQGIWGVIKAVINKILGGIESFVNGTIDGINSLIKGLNEILALGDKVAKAIGLDADIKIPTIKNVSIPRLAAGAVIQPNSEFLAMLGDQKAGVNIETPLSTMVDAFNIAQNSRNDDVMTMGNLFLSAISQMMKSQNNNSPGTVILKVNETELGRVTLPALQKETKRLNVKLAEG